MISGLLFGCWSPAMVSPLPPVCLLPVLAPLSIRNPDDWCGGALFFSYSPPHVICTSFFSGLLLQIRAPSTSLDSIRPAYKAIGLDDILAKPCSILPSVGGSVLGALFSSKAAYSWMIPASSCGVYITSINLVSIPCNNGALELASWCLLSSLTEVTSAASTCWVPLLNMNSPTRQSHRPTLKRKVHRKDYLMANLFVSRTKANPLTLLVRALGNPSSASRQPKKIKLQKNGIQTRDDSLDGRQTR